MACLIICLSVIHQCVDLLKQTTHLFLGRLWYYFVHTHWLPCWTCIPVMCNETLQIWLTLYCATRLVCLNELIQCSNIAKNKMWFISNTLKLHKGMGLQRYSLWTTCSVHCTEFSEWRFMGCYYSGLRCSVWMQGYSSPTVTVLVRVFPCPLVFQVTEICCKSVQIRFLYPRSK